MRQLNQSATANNVSSSQSSLTSSYRLTNQLSKIRFVRFIRKEDEADTILWSFTYRKRRFILQYSIYNGISLLSEDSSGEKLISKLARKLGLTNS